MYLTTKKDTLFQLLRDFVESRGYYMNYDITTGAGEGVTVFRFRRNLDDDREFEIHIVWDELKNVFDAFEGIKQEVDAKLTKAEYDIKLTKDTLDYIRNDMYLTQEYIYKFMNGAGIKMRKPVPPIEKVVFNDPATIVFWADKTKTVVKCGPNDTYDPEKGLVMAIAKKALGNQGNYYNTIKKWLPEEEPTDTGIHIDPLAFAKMGDAIVEGFKRGLDRYFNHTRPNIGKVKKIEQTDEGITAIVELDQELPRPYYLWYHGPDSVAWHKREYPYKDKRNAERYAKRHFPEDWEWKIAQDEVWDKDATEPEDYTWAYLEGEKK